MNQEQHLVIVGAVAAGASCAARARRLSESVRITLFERGPDISFANCGLPYYIGGEITDRSRLALQTPQSLQQMLNVTVRAQTEVIAIQPDRKTLIVKELTTGKEEEISYDKLVLAPGASPLRPPMQGIQDPRIMTLRNLQDMDQILALAKTSRRALIIGAGFIGLEMAEQLVRIGKEVTLVELVDQVLPQLDKEMTASVQAELESNGVRLLLGDGIEGFEPEPDRITARLKSGASIDADMVILSIGVKPESRLASEAGLTLGARGSIQVNNWMQTSHPDIYAAGDVVESFDRITGQPMNLPLGGPANRQGRVIADHIFLGDQAKPYPGHLGTAIVRVFDAIAGVTGWTEKRLKQAAMSYDTVTVTDNNHAGYYPGAVPVTVKILWSTETGQLLGGQVMGADGVDKRLDVLATALAARMQVEELVHLELAYAPPFGSARDVINTAGFAAQNKRDGLVRPIYQLPSEKMQILDVRPAAMAQTDPIPDALNIPFPTLRKNLGKLDRNRPILAVCALGKTSYFASRVLLQNGFDAQSLVGGWRLAKGAQALPHIPAPVHPPSTDELSEKQIDATGMMCPGPLLKLKEGIESLGSGQILSLKASDPGFARDVQAFCNASGHVLLGVQKEHGVLTARVRKAGAPATSCCASDIQPMVASAPKSGATIICFSGELDKALAAFVIANGAAAMGGKASIFFTFWGLNIIRKEQAPPVDKDLMGKMFGMMMPQGASALPLSNMHMAGMGTAMMKYRMSSKQLPNLPGLMAQARQQGVRLLACSMSMEAMGLNLEELVDGVEVGGVADMLDCAASSATSLFI